MNCLPANESDLSTKLYRLTGDLNYEMTLLPTWRTVERWSRREVFTAIIRCKDAMLEAQQCAIRLSRLDNIDAVSADWIEEIIKLCEGYQGLLDFVEEQLVDHAS